MKGIDRVVMMSFVYVLYQRGSNQSGIAYCFGANRSWNPHASVFVIHRMTSELYSVLLSDGSVDAACHLCCI